MRLIYDFFMWVLAFAIRLAALFSPKARLWVEGRRDWRQRLAAIPFLSDRSSYKVLWVHAASLGEFEQGRPVIELFRERYPDWKIVLSFFSPSGYEIRKDYPYVDLVCYLPADTRQNARDFLNLLQPDVAVFVKYEFWANYLFELKQRGTTTLLVSALFRASQPFFKWYGPFWRRMLGCFTHLFVQNESSSKLLHSIGIQDFTVAGDTRVDRVLKIAEAARDNSVVQAFAEASDDPILVVGSSWEADEAVIFKAVPVSGSWKLLLAPHEPSEGNVQRICKLSGNAIRYSSMMAAEPYAGQNCLVIDNVGLLNTLYRYGKVAYIGGGFGKGIHNTLEPAAFGLPILFGPKYEKFEEARQFVARGAAFAVRDAQELLEILTKLREPQFYQNASRAVLGYLEESRGATEKVMGFLGDRISPV